VIGNARSKASVIAVLFVFMTMVGCDFLGLSGPSGPGEIHANIMSPDGAVDGAAVLEITGPTGLGAITSDFGEVYFQRDGNTTRVIIILDDPGLLTFQMRVEDVAELPEVTVVQIADGNNVLRTTATEYEIEWVQLADSDRGLHRSAQ
jgi:hypothetical protein